jgi:hypothetical protein
MITRNKILPNDSIESFELNTHGVETFLTLTKFEGRNNGRQLEAEFNFKINWKSRRF